MIRVSTIQNFSLCRRAYTVASRSPIAFVFDIDGVLLRGKKPIPQAHDTLSLLNKEKIPFILLTNGGGLTEESRVNFLSEKLDIPISKHQIVQSHTPMEAWARGGQFKRVLVVGGEKDNSRIAALNYGFKDVVMPIDIVNAVPAISPHHRFTSQDFKEFAKEVDLSKPFDAILVFNDPRDMSTDIQIVSDLLNSVGGVVGTKRKIPVSSPEVPSIPIIFSNNDYLWANDYNLSRFGQGAFRMIIERLYAETNNLPATKHLESTILGKPYKIQHDYAHWVLLEWNKILHGHKAHEFWPQLGKAPENSPFKKLYMVGDNPESDIRGANISNWESILLRTGVYKDEDWENTQHRPSVGVFDNVLEGVKAVLKK